MTIGKIDQALVLAAGLGVRMRPLTDKTPKPLIRVQGRAMLDWALDHLADANVSRAVVNVHHLADQIEAHVAQRTHPHVIISDERDRLLETGGGVVRALPYFENNPFYVLNGDVVWRNGLTPALARLSDSWDDGSMDGLLLVMLGAAAHGYDGQGDFEMTPEGALTRRKERHVAPFVFTGVQILHPRALDGETAEPFSLNRIYTRLIEAGRLYGLVHDGDWYHVGTPQSVQETEILLDEIRPDYTR